MQVAYGQRLRVSGHVKSYTKHLPCDHGTSVKPSGRLPSFRDRHDGSSLAGISAAVSARFIDGAVSRMTTGRPPARQTMNTILVDVFSADALMVAQIGAPRRRSAVAMRIVEARSNR